MIRNDEFMFLMKKKNGFPCEMEIFRDRLIKRPQKFSLNERTWNEKIQRIIYGN